MGCSWGAGVVVCTEQMLHELLIVLFEMLGSYRFLVHLSFRTIFDKAPYQSTLERNLSIAAERLDIVNHHR